MNSTTALSEVSFLQTIQDVPAAASTTWLILADWLEERDDPRAELVRLRHALHYRPDLEAERRDDRVCDLLAAGVAPCVPTVTNSVGMTFALIPAGRFLMGSPPDEEGRQENEGPQHEVEITHPFCLSIYPVTQEQYHKAMGKKRSYFTRKKGGGPTHPVEQVSWEDAVAFCRTLSARAEEVTSGRVYRLPSEAEWEFACRGGASMSRPFHFGAALSSTQANCDGNHPYGGAAKGPYLQRTSALGSYPPNAFGLFDMHGNVWEWCADWYGKYRRTKSACKDPQGPKAGSARVLRGGSWHNAPRQCRAANRDQFPPLSSHSSSGFRVAFSLD